MRSVPILICLALAIAGAASAQDAPANPLAGKRFVSLEKHAGGERPGGKVNQINWVVRFRDKEYSWVHFDKVQVGDYEFDAKTGAVRTGGKVEASYDASTGVLTWGKHKYKATVDPK